jgi:hypothetical protein
MTGPTPDDWQRAWEFAHAALSERHSVRLVLDGVRNPGAAVGVSLVAGGAVWVTWWVAWYPHDLASMNCVFDAGQVLRRLPNAEHARHLAVVLEADGAAGHVVACDAARLELVELT